MTKKNAPGADGAVVLLVDDQAMVAEAIRRMLAAEEDIQFHYCADPGKALEMAAQVHPTVVLQDLVMPDIDGLTVVRYFRANAATATIPIIVLSTKEDPAVKSEAFSNGATDYLVKLPDQVELIARVRAHSRGYLSQLERDAAYAALRQVQQQLQEANERLAASNAELQRLSAQDGLTGIANRRHFDETLAREWQRALRAGFPLAVVLIDIDYFKPYNDTYGHQEGDACLKRVATALQDGLQRPADLAARYGGEEFVLVLPETPLDGAEAVAEQVRASIQQLAIAHSGSTVAEVVTISMGVAAAIPDEKTSALQLLRSADQALYQAKEQGRNLVVGTDQLCAAPVDV